MINRILTLLFIVLVIYWTMLFGACKTPKWADKKISKIERVQPLSLTKYCAKKYNPIESDSTSIQYIKGDDIYTSDTIRDTKIVNDTFYKYEYITKYKNRIDTFYKTRTIQLAPNNAAIDTLLQANIKLKGEGIAKDVELKSTKKTRNILWGILGILTLIGIIKIIKKFV